MSFINWWDPTGSIYIPPFIPIKTPEHQDWESKRALCKLSGTKGWINTKGKNGTRAKKHIGVGRKIHRDKLEKAIIISLTFSRVLVCSEPAWIIFHWEWQMCGWRSTEGTHFCSNCAWKSSKLWLKTWEASVGPGWWSPAACQVKLLVLSRVEGWTWTTLTCGVYGLIKYPTSPLEEKKTLTDFLSTNLACSGAKKRYFKYTWGKRHIFPKELKSLSKQFPLLEGSPPSWALLAQRAETGKTAPLHCSSYGWEGHL